MFNMQLDGSGRCYLSVETDALWVEGIYDFVKHVYVINAYPIFKDIDGNKNALECIVMQKKVPFFSTNVDDVEKMFESFFDLGNCKSLGKNVVRMELKSGVIKIIHHDSSFEIYLNNEICPSIIGDRKLNEPDSVTCKIAQKGGRMHSSSVRIRHSSKRSAVYAGI